jgi:hypothetical protein
MATGPFPRHVTRARPEASQHGYAPQQYQPRTRQARRRRPGSAPGSSPTSGVLQLTKLDGVESSRPLTGSNVDWPDSHRSAGVETCSPPRPESTRAERRTPGSRRAGGKCQPVARPRGVTRLRPVPRSEVRGMGVGWPGRRRPCRARAPQVVSSSGPREDQGPNRTATTLRQQPNTRSSRTCQRDSRPFGMIEAMRLPSLLRCTYRKPHDEREGTYILRCQLSRFTCGHIHLLSVRDPSAELIRPTR